MIPPDTARTVYSGQDVWLIKYPSVRPEKCRITVVTESVAIAVPYGDDGVLDHGRQQVLKFPPREALSTALAYENAVSAAKAWNMIVRRAISDATESFNENIRLLEARLLPEIQETGDDANA